MNITMLSGKGCVTINGRAFRGERIAIRNGDIIVDGKAAGKLAGEPIITVNVHGNCKSVQTTSGDIIVDGAAGDITSVSGDVSAGDVHGNVATTSGDICCGKIQGNASSVSGSVSKRKAKP